LFESSAVPKPAYWRIVQNRPRYMVDWTPRVNGYSPGSPSRSSSAGFTSEATYTGSSGIPEEVWNRARRSAAFFTAFPYVPSSHFFLSVMW
jgi:hypothetical protein